MSRGEQCPQLVYLPRRPNRSLPLVRNAVIGGDHDLVFHDQYPLFAQPGAKHGDVDIVVDAHDFLLQIDSRHLVSKTSHKNFYRLSHFDGASFFEYL